MLRGPPAVDNDLRGVPALVPIRHLAFGDQLPSIFRQSVSRESTFGFRQMAFRISRLVKKSAATIDENQITGVSLLNLIFQRARPDFGWIPDVVENARVPLVFRFGTRGEFFGSPSVFQLQVIRGK